MTSTKKMNDLVAQQQVVGKSIMQLYSNMKKDSSSRKTAEYLKLRTDNLVALWEEAKLTHEEITKVDDPSHEYWTSEYYQQIEKSYRDVARYIKELVPARALTREAAPVLKQQMQRIKDLQNLMGRVDEALDHEHEQDRYEVLYEKLMGQWEMIASAHREIQADDTHSQSSYMENDTYGSMEIKCEDRICDLRQKIRHLKQTECDNNKTIKLPRVQIPVFGGNYDGWASFEDLFTQIIHNNKGLSNVEKMQHLKMQLKGEAARAVQHFPITGANYEVAWNQLKKRYNNKRLILTKLINKMMDFPPIQFESAGKLQELHDLINESLATIKLMGIDTGTWGPVIGCLISKKWDVETNRLYELSINDPLEIQGLDDQINFLRNRFQSLEAMPASRKATTTAHGTTKVQMSPKVKCVYCQDPHKLDSCSKFKDLSVAERNQAVREKKLCINCLRHDASMKCHSERRCFQCNRSHHTLLHYENKNKEVQQRVDSQKKRSTNHVGNDNPVVLLATALIKAKTISGGVEYMRVLIDQGSQASLITEEAATLLALPRQKVSTDLSGVGAGDIKTSSQQVTVTCSPRFPSNFSLTTNLLVLPKVTRALPEKNLEVAMDQWANKMLADPTFNRVGPIDILLGAEELAKILLSGVHKTKCGLLGQHTEFGWIVSGGSPRKECSIKVVSMTARFEEDEQLKKFWELEEMPSDRILKEEDKLVEDHFAESTKRKQNGRYVVKIPFNEKKTKLGASRPQAMARFIQLEKKLTRDDWLRKEYNKCLQEYIDLGHMMKIKPQEVSKGKYYLPHQAVVKESRSTSKVRVVFDASCKTTTGISLNNAMYVGPRLQQELMDILLRWRSHRVAITADIEKMYRQIELHEADQDYHRILWRFHPNEPVQEFAMARVTFGTAAAPYLAVKVIQQLANDETVKFPKAARVTLQDFYVDDLLSGTDTEEEACQLQNELIQMMNRGGFTIRKWSSNTASLLENLPEELRDESAMELSQDNVRKSLGLFWIPRNDMFLFKVELQGTSKITKRSILSTIAKLFDPLGWLSPVVIKAKLLMQDLWIEQIAWDDTVPTVFEERWRLFLDEIPSIEKIQIPRWIKTSKTVRIELHGFADASEKAYGAVVYSKVTNEFGDTSISMIAAKSKVAPVKTKTTLPKLELCAAHLLAKLIKRIVWALQMENPIVYAWTDSMITLAWIKGDPARWKTFVSNRVVEIHQLVRAEWNHVKSEENPADIISRGVEPSKLQSHKLWWQGPGWLHAENYPMEPIKSDIVMQEVKTSAKANVVTKPEKSICERFSHYSKMIRAVAYCFRFVNRKKGKVTGPLTVVEMDQSLTRIVKMAQREAFDRELNDLNKNKVVDKKSKIANLHPFIDQNGVLRVGGRLQHSLLKYGEKHPMILPYKHHLTTLIIRDAHFINLHGGNQTTLAYIRRKFWIINGKKAVKFNIAKCIKCIRFKGQAAQQLMGQLPEPRVSPASPFQHTGIDYAGPIQIRTSKGRGQKSYKGYVAIFVCLATKAVHIEAVSDMSSEAFMAALRRFTARRGPCSHLYSDNGTTFVGSQRMIEDQINKMIVESDVGDRSAIIGTQWHFNPPAAPHFGGIWEAAVKSMKHHLKRIVGESTLTYEELTTLLSQIEACLNSRPLCPMTDDVNDSSALTPGHFLIGRELMAPSHPISEDFSNNLHDRWNLVQKMRKHFWNVWSGEYLQELQKRFKWKIPEKNLEPGDMVIIKEDNVAPSKWALAKVRDVHPSDDNLTRVVTLQKAGGASLKRPIHKLVPLPKEDDTASINMVKMQKTRNVLHGWKSILIAITIMCLTKNASAQLYKIDYPSPGMYIEHLGHAQVDRGSFRIEVQIDKAALDNGTEQVRQVMTDMEQFCKRLAYLTTEIRCSTLVKHLEEKEQQLRWLKNGLYKGAPSLKHKRGLLGEMLTSVFGVNDEVYRDIESLDKNQHELIRSSTHQTKIMLQALSRFNDTESRIYNQLDRFKERLDRNMKILDDMNVWYKAVDVNKLDIHLLAAYQLASNYLDGEIERYRNILDLQFNNANFYAFLSPARIEELTTAASKNLPSNIQIISHTIVKTEVKHSDELVHVFGYFAMSDINEYMLIKANPFPIKVENDRYWLMDIKNTILAVDYNSQLYFDLTDEDLKNAIKSEKHRYICSPSTIQSIESSPNCIIDEIYQRTENTTCEIKEQRFHRAIWKQLYAINSWLFIVPGTIKVAITCNGIREDVTLNKTGILTISQSCTVNTRKNVLTPKRLVEIPVLATFTRPVVANLTFSTSKHQSNLYHDNKYDVVLKPSDNMVDIQDLVKEEQELQETLHENTWQKIRHHSAMISVLSSVSLIILVLAVWLAIKRLSSCSSPEPTSLAPEEVPLEPLYAQIQNIRAGRSSPRPGSSRAGQDV